MSTTANPQSVSMTKQDFIYFGTGFPEDSSLIGKASERSDALSSGLDFIFFSVF